MPLSRDWTAQKYFDAAYRRFGYDTNHVIYAQKWEIVNSSVEIADNILAPIIGNAKRTKVPYNIPLPTRYLLSGTGTYTAATAIVTATTLNIPFNANDVERPLIVRSGANGHWIVIDSYISGTQVVVRGNNLPTVDLTLDAIEVPATTPLSTSIHLSNLRMQRTGEQTRLILESSATDFVTPKSLEEFKVWRSGGQNRNSVVYCLSGEEILVKGGDKLLTTDGAVIGTFYLYFQRVPTRVVTGTDKIDLPDGTAIQVGISIEEMIIASRLNQDSARIAGEMKIWVDSLYGAAGKVAEAEVLVERVKALI